MSFGFNASGLDGTDRLLCPACAVARHSSEALASTDWKRMVENAGDLSRDGERLWPISINIKECCSKDWQCCRGDRQGRLRHMGEVP